MLYETHDLVIFGRMSDLVPKNCFYYLILFVFYQRGLYQWSCFSEYVFSGIYTAVSLNIILA